MPFEFKKLGISGVFLVMPKRFDDERGYFMETYKKEDFERAGIKGEMVQQNTSSSKKGVLRGLHFQREPHAMAKLVGCVSGEILDVGVDIRKDSPTFGKYVSEVLSGENCKMLYLPRGFAHGFLALSDEALVTYLVDSEFAPEAEGGLVWNDPDVGIDWPMKDPIIKERDRKWPRLKEL